MHNGYWVVWGAASLLAVWVITIPFRLLGDPRRAINKIRRPRRKQWLPLEYEDRPERSLAVWNEVGGVLGIWRLGSDAGLLLLLALAIRVYRDDPENFNTLWKRFGLIRICFIGSIFESAISKIFPELPMNYARVAAQQYSRMCAEINCQVEFSRPDLAEAVRERL